MPHNFLRALPLALCALGCSGPPPLPAPAPIVSPPIADVASAPEPIAPPPESPHPPAVPVPEPLAAEATRFGMRMVADGWTWKAIDRKQTRFDWSGRPDSGDREVLYSFWMPTIDETAAKLLPSIVGSAAANLSNHDPCPPFEQPPEIVKILHVDRVITVCFDPMPFYGKEFHQGVMHGIVQNGALTIVAIVSNDRAAVIPLEKTIGARGVVKIKIVPRY